MLISRPFCFGYILTDITDLVKRADLKERTYRICFRLQLFFDTSSDLQNAHTIQSFDLSHRQQTRIVLSTDENISLKSIFILYKPARIVYNIIK